jgi:HEPN domain-containing protein
MTDFTKTKVTFVLALLGTLFALHPMLTRFEDAGYDYLGVKLRVFHVYAALAGLLSLSVYFYALVMMTERTHSWAERTGNTSYALAMMVLPFYGGLYSAKLLADRVGQSHLAWAAPATAVLLGIGWAVVSNAAAWLVKNHLGRRDQSASADAMASVEIAALHRAQEMFSHGHYDLAVVEAWRAIESRLYRVLLMRGITPRRRSPSALADLAFRRGAISEAAKMRLSEVRSHWRVAVSMEPLSRQGAESAMSAARELLAMISLDASGPGTRAA